MGIRLWVARLGFRMWESGNLPSTGKVLFEFGENEYAADQLASMRQVYAKLPSDERFARHRDNLDNVRTLHGAIKKALADKDYAAVAAKKYGAEELDLKKRSPHYAEIYKVERKILNWLQKRQRAIINMRK